MTHGLVTRTPLFLMAFLSRPTTSLPSTPLALKPLVQDTRKLCTDRRARMETWASHRRAANNASRLTSSSLVCWHGKEKVKPRGSFLSLMPNFSRKAARHSAMWSKSWNRREQDMIRLILRFKNVFQIHAFHAKYSTNTFYIYVLNKMSCNCALNSLLSC